MVSDKIHTHILVPRDPSAYLVALQDFGAVEFAGLARLHRRLSLEAG